MDLVSCPSCSFQFSPTAGQQKLRCPACQWSFAIGGPKPAAAKPRVRNGDEESGLAPIVVGAMAAVAVLVLVLGIGVWFVLPADAPEPRPEPIAQNPPPRPATKINLPQTADPTTPAPKLPEPVTPPPSVDVVPPTPPILPPKAKISPKVRVIDSNDVPEAKVEEPVKTTRIVVKKIAGVDPDKVNLAIRRGVGYLQSTAHNWHTSTPTNELAHISLGGLTLLECGTPASNVLMQSVARKVREFAGKSDNTYALALTVLFLDRFGQASDRPLIRTLAARLIAGQNRCGAWSYTCPLLTQAETTQMLALLNGSRPVRSLPQLPATVEGDDPGKAMKPDDQNRGSLTDPFDSVPVEGDGTPTGEPKIAALAPNVPIEERSLPPKILPRSRLTAATLNDSPAATAPVNVVPGLSARLNLVPSVAQRDRLKASLSVTLENSESDLSNTQFAILALWVSRRHGVASERALMLTEVRLRQTQLESGTWQYKVNGPNTENPSMACAGLLGLALGSAVHQPDGASLHRALQSDSVVKKALDYLGENTQNPAATVEQIDRVFNLYQLWSTERVAVLFHQPTIRGKDWYGWGAQMLLKEQGADGAWHHGGYTAAAEHSSTCLALLFLIRSNLVSEITEQIRLQMPLGER